MANWYDDPNELPLESEEVLTPSATVPSNPLMTAYQRGLAGLNPDGTPVAPSPALPSALPEYAGTPGVLQGLNQYLSQKPKKLSPEAQARASEWFKNRAAQTPEKEKDFIDLSNTAGALWGAAKGLGTTVPAAYYQMTEGTQRPDLWSPEAKAAIAEQDVYRQAMEEKTRAAQAAGTSDSVSESIREAGGSLGFSIGAMGAALPAGLAGAKTGAAIGALTPVPGGAAAGGLIGGFTGAMAGSGAAAYRMAYADFMGEAFKKLEEKSLKNNQRPMTEDEKAQAYAELSPVAENTALWEAGPEAVGNAATLGAGGLVFGWLGKEGLKKIAASTAKRVGLKTAALAGGVGTEVLTEGVTQFHQGNDQAKLRAYLDNLPMDQAKPEYEGMAGFGQALIDVAPQTLALVGMMGGAAGGVKVAGKAYDRYIQDPKRADALLEVASDPNVRRALPNDALANLDIVGTQLIKRFPKNEKLAQSLGAIQEELLGRTSEAPEVAQKRQELLNSLYQANPKLQGLFGKTEANAPQGGADVRGLQRVTPKLSPLGLDLRKLDSDLYMEKMATDAAKDQLNQEQSDFLKSLQDAGLLGATETLTPEAIISAFAQGRAAVRAPTPPAAPVDELEELGFGPPTPQGTPPALPTPPTGLPRPNVANPQALGQSMLDEALARQQAEKAAAESPTPLPTPLPTPAPGETIQLQRGQSIELTPPKPGEPVTRTPVTPEEQARLQERLGPRPTPPVAEPPGLSSIPKTEPPPPVKVGNQEVAPVSTGTVGTLDAMRQMAANLARTMGTTPTVPQQPTDLSAQDLTVPGMPPFTPALPPKLPEAPNAQEVQAQAEAALSPPAPAAEVAGEVAPVAAPEPVQPPETPTAPRKRSVEQLQSDIQQYEDVFKLQRQANQEIPENWLENYNQAKRELEGETNQNAVYPFVVPGHPEHPLTNTSHLLSYGTVPLKVTSFEQAKRRVDEANKAYSDAQGKLASAEYRLSQAKTPKERNNAQKELSDLTNQGITREAIDALRQETLPELQRIYRVMGKRQPKPQETPNAPTVRINQEQPRQEGQEGQPGIQPSPVESGGNLYQPGQDQEGPQPAGEVAPEGIAPTAPAKEPWEMTKTEAIAWQIQNAEKAIAELEPYQETGQMSGSGVFAQATTPSAVKKKLASHRQNLQDLQAGNDGGMHRIVVQEALRQKKPIPAEVLAEYPDLAPAPTAKDKKKKQTVVTATGKEIDTEFEVVELDDLITSDRQEFPAELQPRNRSRVASDVQINRIANQLDPEQLAESRLASDGAPIIGPDQVVESGNGRVMAVRRVYSSQSRLTDKAAAYRQMIAARGFSVEGMKQPVLVRRRMTPMTPAERQAFTVEANTQNIAGLSPTERAMIHAGRLTPAILDLYSGGDLFTVKNSNFVRAFMDRVALNESAEMTGRDGVLNQEGARRIQSAILARAYPNSDLLESLLESEDNNIKAIGGALLDAAPGMVKLKVKIENNQSPAELDITGPLVEAAQVVAKARRENKGLKDVLSNTEMFGDGISPMANRIVNLFFSDESLRRQISRDKMAEFLNTYLGYANEVKMADPLFADIPSVTVNDLIKVLEDKKRESNRPSDSGSLFGGNAPGPRSAADGEAVQRPGIDREGKAPGTPELGEGQKDGGQPVASPEPEVAPTPKAEVAPQPELPTTVPEIRKYLKNLGTTNIQVIKYSSGSMKGEYRVSATPENAQFGKDGYGKTAQEALKAWVEKNGLELKAPAPHPEAKKQPEPEKAPAAESATPSLTDVQKAAILPIIRDMYGDVSRLAGDRNKKARQELHQNLLDGTSQKATVQNSGIGALRNKLIALAGISEEGKAIVEVDRELSAWMEKVTGYVRPDPLLKSIQGMGTAFKDEVSVKVVKLGDGYGVETTVNGDRRLPTEAPMTLEEAQQFARKQLDNPRPAVAPKAETEVETKEYRYALVNRPASIGAVPKGAYRVELRPQEGADHYDQARHGIIVYDRPLTDKEIYDYELTPIVDRQARQALAEKIAADYPADYVEDISEIADEDIKLFEDELAGVMRKLYEKSRVPSVGDFTEFAKITLGELRKRAEKESKTESPKPNTQKKVDSNESSPGSNLESNAQDRPVGNRMGEGNVPAEPRGTGRSPGEASREDAQGGPLEQGSPSLPDNDSAVSGAKSDNAVHQPDGKAELEGRAPGSHNPGRGGQPGIAGTRSDRAADAGIESPAGTPAADVATPAAKPSTYGKSNTVFTEDAAAKARALLKAKLGQVNAGLDPEIVQAGITLAGYHIEAGARSFVDYAKAMLADLGEGARPYLRSWYEAVRYYPGFDAQDMSGAAEIDPIEKNLDQYLNPPQETQAPSPEPEKKNPPRPDAIDKLAAQKAAESLSVKLMDKANIAETLPYLLPEQHEDVLKAEQRLETHNGIMFTNATGTGKTFTGLGVIKRMEKQGKTNGLIVVPTQTKVEDWIKDGEKLLLKITALPDTQTGGTGIVVTTYANFAANDELSRRDFDFIVYDEAHKLMQNQNGESTAYSERHDKITFRKEALKLLARDWLPKARAERLSFIESQFKGSQAGVDVLAKGLRDDYAAINDEIQKIADSLRGRARPKAIFLSASPFAYRENIDYAEGFLFDYGTGVNLGAYNAGSPRDQFMVRHFGYRMRYGKLTTPDVNVDMDLMERQFHEWLRSTGAVSGRKLDIPQDYSREFVEVDSVSGRLIDRGIKILYGHIAEGEITVKNGSGDSRKQLRFPSLLSLVDENLDYLGKSRLLEGVKAKGAAERIKQHLSLGRKVVVFHDYNEGTTRHPFKFTKISIEANTPLLEAEKIKEFNRQVDDFNTSFPEIAGLDLSDIRNVIATLQAAFGDRMATYNGTISGKNRQKAIADFNRDGSGLDVLVVQRDAGKEGISLHDITGKHPRVLMDLGLPTSPTDAIQTEGRVYRYGQESNAIIEYLKANLTFEEHIFASRVATRARTAENMAMGNQSRNLERAFIDAYLQSGDEAPGPKQGTGGKSLDARMDVGSPFDNAISFYFANRKKNARDKSREGKDYYATPEPFGMKMVEWADLRSGEAALEPSAGHGAIARFFPEDTRNTYLEPSDELFGLLELNARGKSSMTTFEDLHIANKYHAILMNPPFGQGGTTAIEHLKKAVTHLRDGGRILIILPEGSATNQKLEKFLDSEDAKPVYPVADVRLPTVLFERAGTAVKTHLLILERHNNPKDALGAPIQRDLSDITTIKEFFGRIEEMGMPPRAAVTPLATAEEARPSPDKIREGLTLEAQELLEDIANNPEQFTDWVKPSERYPDRKILTAKASVEIFKVSNGGGEFSEEQLGELIRLTKGAVTPNRAMMKWVAKGWAKQSGQTIVISPAGREIMAQRQALNGLVLDLLDPNRKAAAVPKADQTAQVSPENRNAPQPKLTFLSAPDAKAVLEETVHAKKSQAAGRPVPQFVVNIEQRLSPNDYRKALSRVKELGGYWSRYDQQGAIPGFQFESREAAERFVEEVNGVYPTAQPSRTPQETQSAVTALDALDPTAPSESALSAPEAKPLTDYAQTVRQTAPDQATFTDRLVAALGEKVRKWADALWRFTGKVLAVLLASHIAVNPVMDIQQRAEATSMVTQEAVTLSTPQQGAIAVALSPNPATVPVQLADASVIPAPVIANTPAPAVPTKKETSYDYFLNDIASQQNAGQKVSMSREDADPQWTAQANAVIAKAQRGEVLTPMEHAWAMWGQQEGQNEQIQKILDHFGSKLSQDAYPWCAPFVAYTFARAGVKGANTQSSRAFLTKGQAVQRAEARPGDVVVLWNDNPKTGGRTGYGGHVGYLVKQEGNVLWVLGGNQNDTVNVSLFHVDRLLGIRRIQTPQTTQAPVRLAQKSRTPTPATGLSRPTFIATLRRRFPHLSEALDKMLARGEQNQKGGLVLVDSNDLDAIAKVFAEKTGRTQDEAVQELRGDGRLNGLYDPRSGLLFAILPNLSEASAPGVFLHENVHAQQRADIDSRAVELVNSRSTVKRPELRTFLNRVQARLEASDAANDPKEVSAYLIEELTATARLNGMSAADGKFLDWVDRTLGQSVGDWVRSIVKAMRGWAFRHGLLLKASSLSLDDLMAWAEAGVQRTAAGNVELSTAGAMARSTTADELLSQVQSGQVDTLTPEQWAQVQRAFLQQSTDTMAPTGTQAPSFQNWFGASRIKNKAGQPLPMYHATEADFTVFDPAKSGQSTTHPTAALGFFFTNDRGHATAKYGSNVMEVYLAIEKPYAMTDADLRKIETVEDAQAFRKKLEAQGYDGIVMPAETRTRYVAAFRSDQIKRTDNQTYTRGEKDVRFSKGLPSFSSIEDILDAIQKNGGELFVRWSSGSKYDLRKDSVSRDYVSGKTHAGLSASKIDASMSLATLARRIGEYGFSRMNDRKRMPYIYSAEIVGTDSDGYQSIRNPRLIGEISPKLVKILDAGLADYLKAKELIAADTERLSKITDVFAKKITEDSIRENQEKITELSRKLENVGFFDSPINSDIRFSKAQESTRIVSAPEITRTLIQPQLAAWNEAGLSVEVVQSVADLPADLQARLPDDSVEGFYETQTGKVYLIADQIGSMERAKEVLRHEAVGHWASHHLRAAPEFVQILKALYRLEAVGNKDIVEIAKQVDATQPGLDRFDRAEEIYSVAVERGLHEKIGLLRTWSTKLLQQVKAWLRKLGFDNRFVNDITLNDVMLWAKESQQRLNQGGKDTYGKWAFSGGRGVAPSSPEEVAETDRQLATVRAQYEGTDQWMKAPNGQPTKLNERQWLQVRTPNFLDFFGNWMNDPKNASQVVDENGEPLVVYHGTPFGGFSIFDLKKAGTRGTFDSARVGMYFQEDTGYVAGMARDKNETGPSIYPVFLSIKNPLLVFTTELTEPLKVDKMIMDANTGNHDGVIDEFGNFVAFQSTQIKSAIANTGEFSPTNPDIRFSRALPPNQYEDAQGNIQDSEAFNPVNGRTELKEQRAIIQRLKEDGFWKTTKALAKESRPAWLKLLTLQQKVEMLQDIKLLKDLANAFENTALAMDADKSNLKQEAFALAEEMRSEMVKARDKGYLLGRILQWSTLKNVVPYKVPERMFYGTTAEFVTATEDYQRLMGMVEELKASNPKLLALYDKIMGKGTVDVNGQKIPNMIERMDELYRNALQERLGRQALIFLKKTLESAQDTRQQTLWQHLRTLSQNDPTGYAQLQQTYQAYLGVIDPTPAQLAGWRDSLSSEQAVLWDDLLIREGRMRNRESQKQIQAMVDNAVDATKTPRAGTLTAALRALHTQDVQAFTELRDALKLRLERYEPNSDQHDAIKNRLPPANQALFEQIVTSNNAAIARFSFKKKLERIKTTAPTPDTSLTGRLHTLFLQSADRFNALSKAMTTRLETLNMDPAKADALRAGLSEPADQALFDELVADAQAKVKPGLTALRELYESRRRAGPYFPLDRFGPYQVYAEREGHGKDGIGLPAFSTFETEAEQQRYVQRMQQEGWTVRTNYQIREALETQAPPNSFIKKVFQQIDDTNAPEAERQALKNDIYQMYLQSLPELSARKHFMKRKGIPGFSGDALRSFAQLMNGKANAIARLRHSDKLTESLESMERVSKAMGQDPTQLADQNRARMIITELKDSFGWMMNPSNATWANRLTSLGFFWYLTNLSTALVNLTQVPIWTFPELGSKFGAGRSLAVLNKTIADYGVWKLRRGEPGKKLYEKLRGEFNGELGLDLDRIDREGIATRTQSVTLAGMGEDAPEFRGGAAGTAAAAWEKTFKIVSWPFHKSEVANREISFIAAYRLARTSEQAQEIVQKMTAAGATPEAMNDAVRNYAYETARNVVLKTQGNYANYNRAPFMRSNIMRVITLFRSYAQMMTWRMLRDTYQLFKTADATERKEVKKRLGLMLASSFLWGGAMGLPIYTVAMSLAGLLFGNDPDDPYEPEEAMKQALRGLLGETGQQILMGGPVGQLPKMANLIPGIDGVTGVDLSPRVSADLVRLWMRRMPGDLEGESAWDWYVTQALGPLAGMGRNAFRAYGDLVSSAQGGGSLLRSLEGTVPAPIRNALKAARFEEEGVTTRRGDLLVPDTNWAMVVQQAIGFTPDTIAAQYAQNTARYEFKDALEKRRKGLTDRYIYAAHEKDPELIKETLEFVKKFNRLNPETPITAKTLKAAYKQWLRARALAEGGVYEPSKGMRARLRREFAEETED